METDRFLLRPWHESDAEALFKYASDSDVGPRAGWEPHKSVGESLQIIRTIFGGDHMWAIELIPPNPRGTIHHKHLHRYVHFRCSSDSACSGSGSNPTNRQHSFRQEFSRHRRTMFG